MKTYLIILCLACTLSSCLDEKELAPYLYKIELNPLRKKIGLRIIDTTFYKGAYGYKSMSTYNKRREIYFYNINLKLKKEYILSKTEASYWKKYIQLNKYSGKPQYEEDIFRSGLYKYGYIEETDIFETLRFRYIFDDYKFYDFKTKDSVNINKGWQYIYEYPSLMTGVTSNKPKSEYWEKKTKQISEIEADSILNSWKLKRLNY